MEVREPHGALTLGEVGVNALPTLWPEIEPLLTEACSYSYGAYTPKSVVDEIFAGRFRMIALADEHVRDVMVIAIGLFPSGLKVMECILASGEDLKAWLAYEDDLDDFARAEGCHELRLTGRKGLPKMLPHWKLIGQMMARRLDGGQ